MSTVVIRMSPRSIKLANKARVEPTVTSAPKKTELLSSSSSSMGRREEGSSEARGEKKKCVAKRKKSFETLPVFPEKKTLSRIFNSRECTKGGEGRAGGREGGGGGGGEGGGRGGRRQKKKM